MKKDLKQACIRQGWTMEEVAERLSISVSYLYKILEGKRCSKKRIKEIEELIEEEKGLCDLPYFSQRVKIYCYSNNLSLKDIASSLNISLSYLYDIMKGRHKSEEIEEKIIKMIEPGVSEANPRT